MDRPRHRAKLHVWMSLHVLADSHDIYNKVSDR